MPNEYFTPTPLVEHVTARASDLNALFAGVAAGFDELPAPDSFRNNKASYAEATGSAVAYVVAMPLTITAYEAGQEIAFKPPVSNIGSCTLNVDGLGARAIKRVDGTNPAAGDIVANTVVEVRYTGTEFVMTSQARGDVTAAAASKTDAASSASAAATSAATAATFAGTLATVGIPTPNVSMNLNTALTAGEYYAADGATGAPTSGTILLNVRRSTPSSQTILQTAYPAAGTARIYLRKSIDGGASWLTWEQLAQNVMVSNANGVARQDPVTRIMISWHTITLIQASSTECNFTWVFPAQYSGSPKVFALGKLPLNASVSNQQLKAPTVANAITGTAALVRQHCTSGTFGPSDSLSVDVMAIGSY